MKTKQLRVASYLRVSTEEQKKFGSSIATQREHCLKWFKDNPSAVCVGEYSDAGVSANKLSKRTELQRLLKDIQDGKIDLVIFTKLDRWFRSVPKYYKIQEILDNNKVAWRAILEDYETVTANGMFKVNIMLAVAQQERDRTSERIKDVFEFKVKNGEPITGSLPFPFKIDNVNGVKRVIHEPKYEKMTYDFINHLQTYNSLKGASSYINDKYNIKYDYQTFANLSKNTMLYGSYRGNDNYCDGYITKKEFEDLQEALKHNVRVKKIKHDYILSQLVVCPVCGNRLTGKTSMRSNKTYRYIMCADAYRVNKKCTFKHLIKEDNLEEQLLEKLESYMKDYIMDCEANINEEVDNTKKIDDIKEEMDRLNFMFRKNRISIDDYDDSYEKLEKKLKTLEDEKPKKADVSKIKALLDTNYLEVYKQAQIKEKAVFWRGIIKEIIIDTDLNITDIIFW